MENISQYSFYCSFLANNLLSCYITALEGDDDGLIVTKMKPLAILSMNKTFQVRRSNRVNHRIQMDSFHNQTFNVAVLNLFIISLID